MQAIASAPGKAILFGEHAVVYGKPAIAFAVDKRAQVQIRKRTDSKVHVKINETGFSKYLKSESEHDQNNDISGYICKSLKKIYEFTGLEQNGLNITINLEIPIGAGLGSSAAITVATIMALSSYNNLELERKDIANLAHQVELEVQGAASPIDTTLSTYGGAIYMSKNAEKIIQLSLNRDSSMVIGYIGRESTTGELVNSVRFKKENYPLIVNPILDSIEQITETARKALLDNDETMIGDLMNINHGLLDALGVNTQLLSQIVYITRQAGAIGSKITGAGGGGSVIAYSPNKIDKVLFKLQNMGINSFPIKLSNIGVRDDV